MRLDDLKMPLGACGWLAATVGLLLGGPIPHNLAVGTEHGATPQTQAGVLVREALQAEMAGEAIRRAQKLSAAIDVAPDHALARWHAAYVRVGEAWLSVAEAEQQAAADSTLAKYRQLRADHAGTLEGELFLARWCRRSGLEEEARAHWLQLLRYEPEHPQALAALDMQWQDGNLLALDQIRAQKQQAKKARHDRKRWTSELTRLRQAILLGSTSERTAALGELRGLDDPAVIPALGEVLIDQDSKQPTPQWLAAEAIAVLGRMDDPRASRALVMQAVLSSDEKVRSAAIEQLKARPLNRYAQILLGAMAMPIEKTGGVDAQLDGMVVNRYSYFREGPAGYNYEWNYSSDPYVDPPPYEPFPVYVATMSSLPTGAGFSQATGAGLPQIPCSLQASSSRASSNIRFQRIMPNVVSVNATPPIQGIRGAAPLTAPWTLLYRNVRDPKVTNYRRPGDPGYRGPLYHRPGIVPNLPTQRTDVVYPTTGVPQYALKRAREDAEKMDKYIKKANAETEKLNEKIHYVLKAVTGADLPATPTKWWKWWEDYYNERPDERLAAMAFDAAGGPPLLRRIPNALARGTLVQTLTGPVPIEALQIGDRVLSQHPESGELAYKAVLAVLAAPAGPMQRMELTGGTLVATPGQWFWQTGRGWCMARDLETGALLHGLKGSLAIEEESKMPSIDSYQLVVANFHTYFVAKQGLLAYDHTSPEATLLSLPGWKED